MLSTPWLRSARETRPSRSLTRLLLGAFLVFAATSAGATPLFFTGPGGFGTDSISALAQVPPLGLLDLDNPADWLGSPEVYGAAGVGMPALDCSDPLSDPLTCIALRVEIPPLMFSASELPADPSADPIEATSTWIVTNSTGRDLAQAFLVFSSTVGAESKNPTLVGLEPDVDDDYLLIKRHWEGEDYYFAAIELGPLAASESVSAEVHYRVSDFLDETPPGSGDFYLPKLLTEAVVVMPEPGTFLLVAAGLVVFAAMTRGRCD